MRDIVCVVLCWWRTGGGGGRALASRGDRPSNFRLSSPPYTKRHSGHGASAPPSHLRQYFAEQLKELNAQPCTNPLLDLYFSDSNIETIEDAIFREARSISAASATPRA